MVWTPPPSGKRGRQQQFSDAAIQTCLTLKVLFGMPLRQTTGFVQRLLRLVGLDWTGLGSTGFQHLMSTSADTEREPAVSWVQGGPLKLLIDSTGIKAEGEGALSADCFAIACRAMDAPMLPDLLNQIPPDQDIGSVTADGAYDTRKCHEAIAARDAHAGDPTAQECQALEADERRSNCP